ncbi:transporter substrate-binding domain-containing protein [Desulfovibrio mangrovi]|uniref:substrate-binding periplasmic protein n=1 Tax=Desulfovibrio mangrovi TaxID=2976983 RepID=UPI002247FC16|nr:transporter substrate-binding domain-containing protein [Desulfovibrio mangrovi]UZP67303.1 transporter substrate-binding domain-containing protein [Desulfovibrio mangrovi]
MKLKLLNMVLILVFGWAIAAVGAGREAGASDVPSHVALATHNLSPYGCYDASGHFDGIAVRAVRYAFAEMGVILELRVVPWKRAQYMFQTGDVDGFFAASKNDERDGLGVLSCTIADQQWSWYYLPHGGPVPSDSVFRQKARVASFHGANMLQWLHDEGYNVVASPPTTAELVELLERRRVDAVLANNLVMEELLRQRRNSESINVFVLKDNPLGVYFSHSFLARYPDFLRQFNEHVDTYRRQFQH